MPKLSHHANPDTLLGQLQRGRGEAYLRLLSTPKREACDLLVECICNDPRLDSQVESRAGYYASIAVEVGLDLGPVDQYLREHDDIDESSWNASLAIETLGELAKRRYSNAADILCDYMAWGYSWSQPLDDLMALGDPHIQTKVAAAIERRFPSDGELETALEWLYLDDATWAMLDQQSKRIAKFANNRHKWSGPADTLDPSSPNLTSLTPKQLLDLADQSNSRVLRHVIVNSVTQSDVDLLMENVTVDKPWVAYVALAGLAHLAPERIFGWLMNFWSSNPEMRGPVRVRTFDVMLSMPPVLTLPLARDRLYHEDRFERQLAEKIFKAHATAEDIPALRAAIKLALQDDLENCYRLCGLVEAFSNLPGVGVVPELSEVFVQFRYSYGRTFAAKAIQATAPDYFQEKFVMECLWDCEEKTRALGAKFAPISDQAAAARLRELASNIWEDNPVRKEAKKRIAGN